MYGMRLLSKPRPRATVRMTLTYKFHPRLTAGVEYNPGADEVAPIANLLVLTETRRRPALILGTSSDRIGINLHPILNYTFDRHALSLIMVRSKFPGVSYSIAF